MTRRKTNVEFVQEVFDLIGNEYEILSEYIDSKSKVKIIHNTCNYTYSAEASSFLRGSRCPKCNGGIKKKNTDHFKQDVFNLTEEEYIVLGEYKKANIKIEMIHKICNYSYSVTPNNFIKGNRCPKCCGRVMNKSTNYFKDEVYQLVDEEYEVVGEYVSNVTKIKIIHKMCGYIFETRPANFLSGRRCPQCFGKPNKTTSIFKDEVFKLVQNEYIIIGEYEKTNKKIKFKHMTCGNEYFQMPSNFLNGNRCPKCFGTERKTQEEFKSEVRNMHGEEYEIVGQYVSSKSNIKIKHRKCDFEWDVIPADFLGQKRKCPLCFGFYKKKDTDFIKRNYTCHSIK